MTKHTRHILLGVAILAPLIALLTLRYHTAVDAGVDPALALRTYAFWAAVCVPTAVLADLLLRTIAEYRMVQFAAEKARRRNRR